MALHILRAPSIFLNLEACLSYTLQDKWEKKPNTSLLGGTEPPKGLTSTARAAEFPKGSVSAARAGSDGREQPQDLLSSCLVGDWGLGGFCIHL